MTSPALPALMLLLAVPVSTSAPAPAPVGGFQVAQLIFHQHFVIRIPRMPRGEPPPGAPGLPPPGPPPIRWHEHRAPACVPADTLSAASVTRDDSVDLIEDDGHRLRARLDRDCRGLDFYSGFYLQTPHDGMLCAKRDAIHLRSGETCEIQSFHRLMPDRP